MMNPTHVRKAIGGASILLGAWWLWSVLYSPIGHIILGEREAWDVFTFTTVLLMAMPGMLAIYFGLRLYRAMTETALKWVVGISAAYGALWLSVFLLDIFVELVPGQIEVGLSFLMGTIVAVLAYLFTVRKLLPLLGAEKRGIRELLGCGVLTWIALLVWMLLSDVFDECLPVKEGHTSASEGAWVAIRLFVPIVVAYAAYKLMAAWLLPAKASPPHEKRQLTGPEFEGDTPPVR